MYILSDKDFGYYY